MQNDFRESPEMWKLRLFCQSDFLGANLRLSKRKPGQLEFYSTLQNGPFQAESSFKSCAVLVLDRNLKTNT